MTEADWLPSHELVGKMCSGGDIRNSLLRSILDNFDHAFSDGARSFKIAEAVTALEKRIAEFAAAVGDEHDEHQMQDDGDQQVDIVILGGTTHHMAIQWM